MAVAKAITLKRMHEFCLDYRHMVRSGKTPGPALDALFMEYQSTCYAAGVAKAGSGPRATTWT